MRQSSTRHRQTPAAVKDAVAPVYLVDAAGKVQYVLVPAEQYRHVRPLLESEEFSVPQSYQAQDQIAHAAGWDDPAMDAYNEYDTHRRTV